VGAKVIGRIAIGIAIFMTGYVVAGFNIQLAREFARMVRALI